MEASQLKALEAVVSKLKEDPTLIYDPQLEFFKEFLFGWGAKVPPAGTASKEQKDATGPQKVEPEAPAAAAAEEEEEEEEPEEPEEPDPERLPEDIAPFPEKSPGNDLELTDEQLDKQGDAKQAAVEALEDGNLEKAVEKYTEAIKIGNATAMMYAKRAEMLLKLKRPCATIADCDAAIEINPDSAKAFRIRGKAKRLIGRWEEAHKDLSVAQKLDFDDDTVEVQKLVAERWKKIDERKTKLRIKTEAREKKRKEADIKRRKEEAKKRYEEQKRQEEATGVKQGDAKQAAVEALEDGNLEKAVEKYTEAIKIGNATAMMYAKRAEMLLKLKRPCATIADCDAAIEINPDSAKAFRIRGKAERFIGRWEEAHKDLSVAQKLDFDDDTVEVQKLVAERWKKIDERKTKLRIKTEAREKKRREADMKRRKEE
eukprot:CAMPEP_0117595204 /NCGR_PEP_ID=MMETSP0784-20121206/73635_1 /TAXON_ID=39447 /ORGANISM="" /LENGTH=428 /DNA_ID=CAMNT_0005397365 /DNA_START=96 /DNA_END=1379 /DNA_ORIENTATION=+